MADAYTWNNPNSIERKAIESFLDAGAQRLLAKEWDATNRHEAIAGLRAIIDLRSVLDLRPSEINPLIDLVAQAIESAGNSRDAAESVIGIIRNAMATKP